MKRQSRYAARGAEQDKLQKSISDYAEKTMQAQHAADLKQRQARLAYLAEQKVSPDTRIHSFVDSTLHLVTRILASDNFSRRFTTQKAGS
jgi:response regulator of citrate/malate metabolism